MRGKERRAGRETERSWPTFLCRRISGRKLCKRENELAKYLFGRVNCSPARGTNSAAF